MPRPTRKQPSRPNTRNASSLVQKENHVSPPKRAIEDPIDNHASPPKRPVEEPIDMHTKRRRLHELPDHISPPPSPAVKHSPKPMSPRYGRRTSSAHSPHNAAATSAGRRLAFDTTARLSDASDLHVFDGLIDGFSPIKKAPLPEEDDDDDEKLEDRLNDKGSDSEVFDIDALLAKPSKLSPSSKLCEGGLHLPRRTRARAPPSSSSLKTAVASAKQKPRSTSSSSSSSSSDDDDLANQDSWNPSSRNPRRKPAKKESAKKESAKKASAKKASAKKAPAKKAPAKTTRKPSTIRPSNKITSPWSIDPNTANHFKDIDGFELAEEAV